MNKIHTTAYSFLISLILLVCSNPTYAQLEVISGLSAEELAAAIAGPGIQIQNPQINGASVSYGSYSTDNTSLPFGNGVILTTGKASNAIGPNNIQHKSYINSYSGSTLLDTTLNQITNDACTFEFDIIPQGDTIRFNFTFASEEYHNFVGSIYSDVFGFYISGPGIIGYENIAIVPGTVQPISINTINSVTNNGYFEDNDNPAGVDLQYNGYTIGLEAIKAVTACETYHLTLVIADANDYSIDSGVFIEKIESPNASLSSATAGGIEYMVEGCNDGTVTFTRLSTDDSEDITLSFYVDGTAINGVDYLPQIGTDPDPAVVKTIQILSGQSSASITVSPVDDNIPNVDKYIAIYLASNACPDIIYDSLFFPIFDSLIVNISPDTAICIGESVALETFNGGSSWSWTPSATLDNPNAPNPIATPDSSTIYTLYTTASFCEAWDSTEVIVSQLEVVVDTVKFSCDGYNDGLIAISISNGIAPYSINWTGPNGFTSSDLIITALEAGVYTYTVSDAISCVQTGTVDLLSNGVLTVELNAIVLSPYGYNIACNGDSTGSIYSTVSGGTPGYQYLWSSGVQNTSFLSDQSAGNYTLLVVDSYNCFALDSVTLTQPSALSISLDSLNNIDCSGENYGYIEVSASGGVPTYTYNWDTSPPSSGNILENTPAGTYTLTLVDEYLCSATETYTLSEPAEALSLTIDTILDVQCPGNSDGEIRINATGGTAPYIYSWNTSPIQNGNIASGLASGIYQVSIIDSLGCEYIQSIEVELLVQPLSANISSKENVLCHGDSSGSAAITVSGGSGPFTYLWTPGGYTSSSMVGLGAGSYSIAITDNGLCSQSTMVNVTIDQPSDFIDLSLNSPTSNGYNLSCFESGDGVINTTISGGTPAYNYAWTGPSGFTSTNQNINALAAGLYILNASDQNGCSKIDSILLTEPDEITMTFVMTPATCPTPGSNDGSIDITVAGGVPNYLYSWTGPSGFTANTADITNLEAGVYNLSIEDDINCFALFSVTVTQPDNFTVVPTFSTFIGGWNVSCYSNTDGEINVAVSDVALPVQYSWNYEGIEISTDTFITNASAGDYELIITDANNCIENRFYSLNQPDSIVIDFDAFEDVFGNSISCNGGDDGELTATISGGTPNYTWLWTYSDNSTSSTPLIQDLEAGSYSLEITDINSCIGFDSISISDPDTLTIALFSPDSNGYNVTCFDGNDGSIISTINGGTPPYIFQWVYPGGGIGSSDQNPGNLQAGTYILLLSDANSCTATDTITLVSSDPITYTSTISDYNGFAVPCNGDSIASVDIIPQGGTPPYIVVWENGDTTFTMTGLPAGTYGGWIYDSQNCIGTFSIDVIEPQELLADFEISSFSSNFQIQCNGDSSAYIYTTISGGTAPYTINWTGPNAFTSTNDSISTLVAGDYSISITDLNSCSFNHTITLSEPDSLSVSIDQINSSICSGDSTASLIVNTNGGITPYSYSWTGPNGFTSDLIVISDLIAGTYCVEVSDQNTCAKTLCYDIIDPAPITISLSSPVFSGVNILCNGDSSGSISSLVSGGYTPYTYVWTGPPGVNLSGTNPTNLIAGAYTLTIIDSLGCVNFESIVLTESDAFINDIVLSDYNSFGVSCYASMDGSISISTINGSAPYTYTWSDENGPIAGNDTLLNLSSGYYYVLLSDLNGCTFYDTTYISTPDSISIALISPEVYPGINLSCKYGADGIINSIVAGGVEDYTYSWTGPNSYTSSDSSIVQLEAGWYNLSLQDQNNCLAMDSIELVAPDSLLSISSTISIQNSGTNVSCFNGDDGSISLHISGGIPNYQVYWLGPNGFSSNDTLIENLLAGTYFLSVVDSASCTYSEEFILSEPIDSLIASVSTLQNICFGDSSASIELIPSGGTSSYTIDWEGPDGFISTYLLIDNLVNGSYSYQLLDTNACALIDTISIQSAAEIQANETHQNIDCSGDANGSISLNPTGGGSSYIYSWTGPNGFLSDLQTINNLDSGEYCVSIETDLLCSASFCFLITESVSLNILDSLVNPICGYANGSIFLEINGGTSPYQVDWGTQTGTDLLNVVAGSYTATITDSLNCISLRSYTLNGPDSIQVVDSLVNNSCFNTNDGSISIQINGGTPSYEILWMGPDGYSSSETFIDSLKNGQYQLSIVDSLGCSIFNEYEIFMPSEIEATIYSPFYDNGFNVSTYGNNDGSIQVTNVHGGAPPYNYSWIGPDGFNSDEASISELLAGQYYFQILDFKNCQYLDSIILTQPESLIIPTGFTPNGDGYNDQFEIPGINEGNPASIKIYNRWGNIVYENSNYENDWDGSAKSGSGLPEGTYFVIVEFIKDSKTLNGYIDLRR